MLSKRIVDICFFLNLCDFCLQVIPSAELKEASYFKAAQMMPLRNGNWPRSDNLLYAWLLEEFRKYRTIPSDNVVFSKINEIFDLRREIGLNGSQRFANVKHWYKHFRKCE